MHALIIEDQFLIAALIEDVLRDLGYTSFDIVDSEDGAVTAAAERRPDLITSAQQLAAGTGVGAVRAICASSDFPTVFITDFVDEVLRLAPGAVCIGKPFGDRKLRDAVGKAVALAGTMAA
jgi:DNA-binding response OmpR family regulator